jgi:hypothetical protein
LGRDFLASNRTWGHPGRNTEPSSHYPVVSANGASWFLRQQAHHVLDRHVSQTRHPFAHIGTLPTIVLCSAYCYCYLSRHTLPAWIRTCNHSSLLITRAFYGPITETAVLVVKRAHFIAGKLQLHVLMPAVRSVKQLRRGDGRGSSWRCISIQQLPSCKPLAMPRSFRPALFCARCLATLLSSEVIPVRWRTREANTAGMEAKRIRQSRP